jgi:signal transduction histidine kinase
VTRRLLLSYVSIIMLVLLLLEIPLGIALADAERRRLETDVQRDAVALVLRSEEFLEKTPTGQNAALQTLAEQYQREHEGRVVFVDTKGHSVADSDPPTDANGAPSVGRSFATRPEIEQALQGKDVLGERYSDTLGTDLLYAAVPILSGGDVQGAVRITYPLSFVNSRIRRIWLVLAGIGAVVLLVVSLVCIMLSRSLTRPIGDLERGARALGRGQLDTRVALPSGPHELRALARSFNSTAARLEQLVDAQRGFVADASHQLRTPLAALRLRLENLADEVTPEGSTDLAGATEEVARLSLLVDGLLALARAEQHGSQPTPVDVREVVDLRCDAWRDLAAEQEVALDVTGPSVLALTTPGRLEQVLDNLLNNALEVAPPGSSINLDVRRDGDEILITVADAGPGMTDEQRAHAFDRFWRAEERESTGFGLGLAIVRQLAVADGGDVTLAAATDGGLEVIVTLPAANPQARRGDPAR